MPARNRQSSRGKAGCGGDLPLPVLGDASSRSKPTIRASKNAPRRAIVLALVQLLIIAHIVHWLVSGSSISPIEPSEAMEFSKKGVVNAGLIFFALALLSTLILGRWFCGWACHVVMLQDLCGWMMKKMGIRPKPFRSRLLMWVPLLLGLYMFIWPAFYRLVILPWRDAPTSRAGDEWEISTALTTTDFWQTFPGVMVAVPFLLICGFATVYFLGSKGFCTYGCPYGGFFAPLDEFAPGRIRVTDACEQCGHCTAVCTSNVRVHEEVREYGMVVDPGCMKCLDCVSVCPNDALYFGFGKTAANKGQPKNQAPKRNYDLSMREELAFAAVFAIVFFSFRGDYVWFPLLMAAGVAMVLTWLIWKAWRLTRERNAKLHRHQLKLAGRIKPAGWMLAAISVVTMIGVLHSGATNAANALAGWYDGKIAIPPAELLAGNRDRVTEVDLHNAQRSLAWFTRAHTLAGGRMTPSSTWRAGVHMRLAWLHMVLGDLPQAEAVLREGLTTATGDMRLNLVRSLGLVLAAQGARSDEALAWYRQVLVDQPIDHASVLVDDFMAWAYQSGRIADAGDLLEARLQVVQDDSTAMRWLALLLLDRGEFSEGIAMLQRAVATNPHDQAAWNLLRTAQQQMPLPDPSR